MPAHARALPHDQHRPIRDAHERFGDAAEQQTAHAAATMRADHDQVRIVFGRRTREHIRYVLAARVDCLRDAAHAGQLKRRFRIRRRDRGLVRRESGRIALVDVAAVDVRDPGRVRYHAQRDDQAARIARERNRLVEREPRTPAAVECRKDPFVHGASVMGAGFDRPFKPVCPCDARFR